VARVLALVPDLLFGSRLLGSLQWGAHDVQLVADPAAARATLAGGATDVLLVDLTDVALDGPGLIAAWRSEEVLGAARTLGFYAHVDSAARERAQGAGFDLVVPRSRMAREAAQLIERLASGAEER
jgi:DNA-binding NarL/FixJ family response regulator